MRLIDADALEPKFVHGRWDDTYVSNSELINAPTIDAVKHRHGKWIEEPNCWYRCSECGQHYPSMRGYMYYNFCPSCGADMGGSEE